MAMTLRLLGAAAGLGLSGAVHFSETMPVQDPVVEQLQARASKRNSETPITDSNNIHSAGAALTSYAFVDMVDKMFKLDEKPERVQMLSSEEIEHASKYKGVLFRIEVQNLFDGSALRFKMDGGCTQHWGQVPVNCLYLLGSPLEYTWSIFGNASQVFEEGDYIQYETEATMGQGLGYMTPKPKSVTCKACASPGDTDNTCAFSVNEYTGNFTLPECGKQIVVGVHSKISLPVPHSKYEEKVLTNFKGEGSLSVFRKDGTPIVRMLQNVFTGDIYKLTKMLPHSDMPSVQMVGELKTRMRGGPGNEPYYTEWDTEHISQDAGRREISNKGAPPTVAA